MAFSPIGTAKFLNVSFPSISNRRSSYTVTYGRQNPSFPVADQMLAAQQIIQGKGGHFIKVTGVKQIADSLVVAQT